MNITDLSYTAQAFDALGIALPAEFERARSVLGTAQQTAAANPAQDVLDDFLTGSSTAALVEKVRAAALDLTATQAAHQIIRDLQNPLGKHAAAAIRADADRLIAELAARFDEAASAMIAAAELFDTSATAEDVLRIGPAAAAAWAQLDGARATLDRIDTARGAMFHYGVPSDTSRRVLMYLADVRDPISLATAQDAFETSSHLAGPGGRWHALAATGLRLHLNTAAEVAALEDALRTDQERQAAEQQAARTRMSAEQQADAEHELRMRTKVMARGRRSR